MLYRTLAVLPFALLLCQCKPAAKDPTPEAGDRVDIVAPPPSSPYGFDVALTLSPAAKAKLERLHEQITVSGMYYGMPGPGHEKAADEMGQINLGSSDSNVLPSASLVHVAGVLAPDQLALIKDEPLVLVNIYTARLTSQDNLLDCGIFEDTVAKARATPVTISCKLIYPDPDQGGAQ